MKVWVVIVTYNGKKWLDKSIGNLLCSTIQVEIIVIDNGSIDGTQDLIKRNYPTVNFIQSNENLGFGKANNIGIKKAYDSGADFVFLLNQDAWVEKETIEKLVQAAKNNPRYDIVSPIHLNGKGDALDYNFSFYQNPRNCPGLYSDIYLNKVKDTIYPTKYVNAAAWLLSRECIETVGGFNPLFQMYGEDDNYLHRVHYHDFKVGIYPFVRIYHDRENRKPKIINVGEEKRLLVKYSNPNEHIEIKKEAIWAKKGIVKAFLKVNKQQLKIEFRRLCLIKKIKKEVEMNKTISKEKGMSFLS